MRLLVGWSILYNGYTAYFAGDHDTYDTLGWSLSQAWQGNLQHSRWLTLQTARLGQNGMYYWVALLYTVFGHSPYAAVAAQILVVSLTPILTYLIVKNIFGSARASRYAAAATAFLPSMVIWSCLLLKDPLIILLLVIIVFFTIKMQKEVRFRYILPASIALIMVFPLRGYIFYFILLAVVGTLLMARFGARASLTAYFARLGGLFVIAACLFAFGFHRIATEQIDARLLEKVQSSRLDLAHSAKSGFAPEANVSTLAGSLAFLPKGVFYLLFAPFPWQAGSARSMLAIPETICWYVFFPYFVIGTVYTVRRHLRDALVILLFVVQLTCFYGIFVGNLGTAHRQRTQIFVFYIALTSVGWVYRKERRRASLTD